MVKYTLLLAALAVVALPTFALAAWNPTSMSSYPECRALSSEMSDCRAVTTTSVIDMNNQNMMCPMVMPVQTTEKTITPVSAEASMPQDVTMITTLVPVSIKTISGNDVICASMDDSMANKVVMLPMNCNNQQVLQPVQLKPASADMMILVPLDASMTSETAPASVAVFIDGNMSMIPIDCKASLSSNTLCVAATNGQTQIKCDKNKY